MRRYSLAEYDLVRQIKSRVYSFLLKYVPEDINNKKRVFRLQIHSFSDYLTRYGSREVHCMTLLYVVRTSLNYPP